jgi:TM2 domain-containing membrane protein YozV
MTLTESEKRRIEEEERYRTQVASTQTSRKHGVPALLSFFIPGLGQIVKGQVGKGIFSFIGVGIGLIVLVIPGVIIWIWQIVDAYND